MAQTNSFSDFKMVSWNGAAGVLEKTNGAFVLKNSASKDGVVFAQQPFVGNGQIIARVQSPPASPAKMGVMFQRDLGTDALRAGIFLTGNDIIFERRIDVKSPRQQTVLTNETSRWLRVVREGNAFSGFVSDDGTNWIQFSADTIEMPEKIFAGLALNGEGEARFEPVRLTSARLISPATNSNYLMPTNVLLKAEVANFGDAIRRVEFFSGTRKIIELDSVPYSFLWTNVLGGFHSLTAKVTDNFGAEFFTEPVECEVKLPPARATFVRVDEITKGNWKGKYGGGGFMIANDRTNFPAALEVHSDGWRVGTWENLSSDVRSLARVESEQRTASSWWSFHQLEFNLKIADGKKHQVAFYFLDWDNNHRVQLVEITDAQSGKVLDARRMAAFTEGKYLAWSCLGDIKIKIKAVEGRPALSGIFFDEAAR